MFGFPQADYTLRTAFRRNFLRAVVIHIQFEETKVLFKNKIEIHSSLIQHYPRLNDGAKVHIKIKNSQTPIVDSEPTENFIVRSMDGKKQIAFTTNAIEINLQGDYTSFEDICKADLNNILEILKKQGVEKVNRISFRKINAIAFIMKPNIETIDIARDVLSEAVVESFLSTPGFKYVKQNINAINYKSGIHGMNLHIGFNSQQSTDIGHFTCDIERYITDTILIDDIQKEMEKINKEIFDVFMWFLSDRSITFLKNG